MAKYYLIENMTLEIDNFPKEYPKIFLFTETDLSIFKSLLARAQLNGFNPRLRKLCFDDMCIYGETIHDIFQKMQSLEKSGFQKAESDDFYNLLQLIPHWNPIEDAIDVLQAFNKASLEIDKNNSEIDTKQIIEEAMQAVSSRTIKIYAPGSNPGIITIPDIIK